MRTLKKALCLVLCLVMMVGLCAIGASAIDYKDYPDKDKIKYEEAVKVLTAIGVLQGDLAQGLVPEQELLPGQAPVRSVHSGCNWRHSGIPSHKDLP